MKTRNALIGAALAAALCAGQAGAAVLLSDNFDGENLALNYTGFANWNVVNGTVDLVGPPNFFENLCQGHGRCVDLDGSTSNAGTLTSKQSFTLPSGGTFALGFDLGGSLRGDVNIVDVTLAGISLFSFTVNSGDPYTPHQLTLVNGSGNAISGPITFHNRGGDNLGAILDNVLLTGPAQLPEPPTIALFVLILGGLGLFRRRRLSR